MANPSLKDISHPICTIPLNTNNNGKLEAANISKLPPAAFPNAHGRCRTEENHTRESGAIFCHLRSRYSPPDARPSTTAGTQ